MPEGVASAHQGRSLTSWTRSGALGKALFLGWLPTQRRSVVTHQMLALLPWPSIDNTHSVSQSVLSEAKSPLSLQGCELASPTLPSPLGIHDECVSHQVVCLVHHLSLRLRIRRMLAMRLRWERCAATLHRLPGRARLWSEVPKSVFCLLVCPTDTHLVSARGVPLVLTSIAVAASTT